MGYFWGEMATKGAVKKDYLYHKRQKNKVKRQLSPAQEMAVRIMRLADRHSKDGELTILELKTFLERTEFQGFMMYLLNWRPPDEVNAARPDGGGGGGGSGDADDLSTCLRRHSHFKGGDSDHSGKLDMAELEELIGGYLINERETEVERKRATEARRASRDAQRDATAAAEAAPKSAAAATAYELMAIADGHAANGRLSCAEIETFMTAPQYVDFVRWLKRDGYRVFKRHDIDNSGDVELSELEKIVHEYVAPRDPHPSPARLPRLIWHQLSGSRPKL